MPGNTDCGVRTQLLLARSRDREGGWVMKYEFEYDNVISMRTGHNVVSDRTGGMRDG